MRYKSGILDKVLERVAPNLALQRAIARHDLESIKAWSPTTRGGYAGGNSSRMRKQAAFSRSYAADEDHTAGAGLLYLQLESMDLYRNNPLARGIVEIVRRYARQSRPSANSAAYVDDGARNAALEWDKRATDYFTGYWWNRADFHRRPGVTFGTLQDFYITTQFTQGDIAYIWTGEGFLAIEGLQIQTPAKLKKDPAIRYGFRYDSKGRQTHMYWCEWGSRGHVDNSKYHRVPMSSVLFCPWYWRTAATRAVPRLHGVIDALRDHEEIHNYTKTKVKHESMLLSVERSGSRSAAPGSKLSNSDGTKTIHEEADYGMRFKTTGDPNSDFILSNGQSPNAQYVPLMEYDGKLLAAGTGVPYKAFMSLFDGSWSSNKSVQAGLREFVQEVWRNRRDTFTQRAWNLIIADAIRSNRIPPAPVDANGFSLFNRAKWTRPYFPQLDQQKEEVGRSLAFRNLTQSVDDWAEEQGLTADELFTQHKRDMLRLQADAEELGIPLEQYAAGLLSSSISTSIAIAPKEESE